VEIPDDAIVIMYAGERDVHKLGEWWRSLDEKIEQLNQRVAKRLLPIDIERNKRTQDMLAKEPYNSLCTAAEAGKLSQITGSPNCRTWSVLRLRPLSSGKGKPCRGRTEDTCWGLPDLQDPERKDDRIMTDQDSIMLVRYMFVTWLAWRSGSLKGTWLEHPVDPNKPGWESELSKNHWCSSIWAMEAVKQWSMELGLQWATFHQGALGAEARKATTLAHMYNDGDINMQSRLDGLTDKEKTYPGRMGTTKELARYPDSMMTILAEEMIRKECEPLGVEGAAASLPLGGTLHRGAAEESLTGSGALEDTSRKRKATPAVDDYIILDSEEMPDRKRDAHRHTGLRGPLTEMITMGFKQRPQRWCRQDIARQNHTRQEGYKCENGGPGSQGIRGHQKTQEGAEVGWQDVDDS